MPRQPDRLCGRHAQLAAMLAAIVGSAAASEPVDAAMSAPQITTDDDGVHRDTTGRRYDAVTDPGTGELTYRPVDEGGPPRTTLEA
jgi:hypothetical protein